MPFVSIIVLQVLFLFKLMLRPIHTTILRTCQSANRKVPIFGTRLVMCEPAFCGLYEEGSRTMLRGIVGEVVRVVVQGSGPGPRYGHVMSLVGQRFLLSIGGNDGEFAFQRP